MFTTRKMLFGLAAVTLVVGLSSAMADRADAQVFGPYLYHGTGYPVYHGSSIHYDRVYTTTPHYTPGRGWHTDTRSYIVPHYVPGHIDRVHGRHLHYGRRHFGH